MMSEFSLCLDSMPKFHQVLASYVRAVLRFKNDLSHSFGPSHFKAQLQD